MYYWHRHHDNPQLVSKDHAGRGAESFTGPTGRAFGKFVRAWFAGRETVRARGDEPQTPHSRDEVYVVAQGSGEFVCDGARQTFGPNDMLFAAAGVEHRFENFSDDFAVWVMFYGPEGGEIDRS